MPIPADQLLIAETGLSAIASRVPLKVRDKLQVRFRQEKQSLIMFERRPGYLPPHDWIETPVAKFTWIQKTSHWKLLRSIATSAGTPMNFGG